MAFESLGRPTTLDADQLPEVPPFPAKLLQIVPEMEDWLEQFKEYEKRKAEKKKGL